jgi:hypothetical protein
MDLSPSLALASPESQVTVIFCTRPKIVDSEAYPRFGYLRYGPAVRRRFACPLLLREPCHRLEGSCRTWFETVAAPMRALREYTVVVAVGGADWASAEASAPQNIARIRIALIVLASRNILLKM